ncbi:SRPBCC family protein [Levilactobacillus fuyuanensis]|uniref:SRPBCC family protein n=1 Tax=Levilactobacillus fuyuanensis TaxID=2486022 RepID=A0ABW4H332_9LACO|nr:SRPBCC family protein [Levilactobacillus fuyuanensis]
MSEILFQNHLFTRAPQQRLHMILSNLENLRLWDTEITQVTMVDNGVDITRQAPALNVHEHLTVTTSSSQVIYHSQGGRLAYQLTFTLSGDDTQTVLTETLSVPTSAGFLVPLKLVAPIAKQAFAQKLAALIILAESDWAVND